MMRFIMPIILIVISISLFFVFTNPIYNDISLLQTQIASYNSALDNSKALENERDKLTAKYNSITTDNLAKLARLLPQNVDNIRLILEIEQIAMPYGMVLKDVKYNTATQTASASGGASAVAQGGTAKQTSKDYGVFDLEFSTSGTYNSFINFTKDLESNLRIVDISAITFSSDVAIAGANAKTILPEIYKYNFKIKTYWLKS